MSTAAEVNNKPAAASGGSGVLSHRQILTILVGLMMGMFLAALDQTIVTTAMRTIADDLKGFDLQAWATTAFLITSTISTPLYGKLSDIYGRKPFFLFAHRRLHRRLGAVRAGRQSMYELAAFRALQGIGAGGLLSLALAIIGDIVPPRERAKYQGYFLAVFGTSSVLGPVLGGFFAGTDSILGRRRLALDLLHQRADRGRRDDRGRPGTCTCRTRRTDHRIDWPGALALIVGLVPLLIVAEQGRTWGWGSGGSLTCYSIGADRNRGVHPGRALRTATTRCSRCGCSAARPSRSARSAASSSAWRCSAACWCCRCTCRSSRAPSPTKARPGADPVRDRHHVRLDHSPASSSPAPAATGSSRSSAAR